MSENIWHIEWRDTNNMDMKHRYNQCDDLEVTSLFITLLSLRQWTDWTHFSRDVSSANSSHISTAVPAATAGSHPHHLICSETEPFHQVDEFIWWQNPGSSVVLFPVRDQLSVWSHTLTHTPSCLWEILCISDKSWFVKFLGLIHRYFYNHD